MGRLKRLVALSLGLFLGYSFSQFMIELSKQGMTIYPEYTKYNLFTALLSGHFRDWLLWNFYTHPYELTLLCTIVGGLIAVCLVK